MRFIELFAGIGGFRLGLERASIDFKCVFANEWLEKPRRIYAKQFGEQPDPRDIREITADSIPDADLIVGGFPCATFSIAGKRQGFSLDDTRGTLCFEMFRLARDKRIPYILFENVKGLLNHDRGRTFQIILSALDEMGYDAEWELLDSQNFGVPQHRERIFLIASVRGKPRPKVFPITRPSRENVSQDTGQGDGVTQWRRGHFRDYKSEGVPTLKANMGTGGHNVPFVYSPHNNSKSNVSYTLGQNPQCSTAKAGQLVNGIRKLTPIECERLQGFPDNYTKFYDDGSPVPDSERYERCGRTVSIPVIEAIGKKIILSIGHTIITPQTEPHHS